jgi:hypothetical protein
MATAEPRHIDWGSAQIEDGTLTVELTGSASKAWRARFENVLALLDTPHSSWGEIQLAKSAIKVADPQPGCESELRHLLESVLLQANSDTQPGTLQQDDEDERDHEPDPDEQMAATFRGFATEATEHEGAKQSNS